MSRLHLFIALLLTACASSAPATLPKATNANPVAVAPSAAPRAESSAEPAPPEDPRTGAPGSTLKTISCEKARCKAGSEVCTRKSNEADPLTCLPKSTPENGQDRYACDDSSDCPAPTTCCMTWASANEDFACHKPDDNCKDLPCSAAEGTRCPEGQSCQKNGLCGVPVHSTCGSDQQCPADKPYCAWSGSGECVSKSVALAAEEKLESGGRVTGLYRCTKASDCGTQLCCTSTGIGIAETFCMHSCYSGITQTVCDSSADCVQFARERCGKDAACRKRVRCAALPPTPNTPNAPPPPWMKLCTLDE
ncbi:MAG: hypothetical protein ABIQ16_22100 [Polyangiaceae bacterium]